MSLSMYQATVPVFVHMLENLSAILYKASDFAATRKIEPSVLINARLAPDMFCFARQIQIATDIAKGCVGRLGATEIPVFTDTETTFAELQERIGKTIAFLQSVNQAKIDGSENCSIKLTVGKKDYNFSGLEYFLTFAQPNFYFHLTTAYNILRHNGLDIGKRDYLGDK